MRPAVADLLDDAGALLAVAALAVGARRGLQGRRASRPPSPRPSAPTDLRTGERHTSQPMKRHRQRSG
jgi:hypothetical protein